jgi:glycerol-3-phosphate dehydrogenase
LIEDSLNKKKFNVRCKTVINATGVFTDDIMLMDDPAHKAVITVSQGTHIVVDDHFFPGNKAMIIPATDDGRVLFAVPWYNKVVIGTTDTLLDHINIEPKPSADEVDFILLHINRYLSAHINRSDIKTVFAGLRPLIGIKGKKSTSLLPRNHTTMLSNSGLVSITGGKWTTYRTMGKSAVDYAAIAGKLEKKTSKTESLPIHGFTHHSDGDEFLAIYGSDAPAIRKLMNDQPVLQEKLHKDLPYTKAVITWAVQYEMAITVEDVLARRTRALFLDAKAAVESAALVAQLMAKELNETIDWQNRQIQDFTDIATNFLID